MRGKKGFKTECYNSGVKQILSSQASLQYRSEKKRAMYAQNIYSFPCGANKKALLLTKHLTP